jgi:hypothetical protein
MVHPSTPAVAGAVGTAVIALGLAASAGTLSGKQTEKPPGVSPGPARQRCTSGEASAVTELSCELAANLGSLGERVVVIAGLPTADRAVARGRELSGRIATTLANALGAGARALPGGSTRAEARGASVLVNVAIEIAGGEVRIVADTHPTPRGFWERVRGWREAPGAHAFASRRLDGEIASFLPPVPLVATRIDKAANPTPDLVALACGDVDADSSLEIAVVGRRKIQLGRVRQSRFVQHAEIAWTALSSIAPSPLREPLARAEIISGHFLTVGSTDRESAWLLSSTLAPVRRLDASVPWARVGCLVRTGTALGMPAPCERGGTARFAVGDVPLTDAVASGVAVNAVGKARTLVAWRAPGDGAVTLRDDAGRTARVPNIGAALAIADVDLDGVPELVASENTPNPEGDAVVLRSWGEDGTLRERLRVPVPDGIRAIAACPAEDAGMAPLVVATPTSLWIIR